MDHVIKDAVTRLSRRRDQYERAAKGQRALFMGEPIDRQPFLLNASRTPDQEIFPETNFKDIHFDRKKMACSELRNAFCAMNGGRESAPSVRANMGCGIVPALFGLEPLLFEDKMPWVKDHLPKETLKAMTRDDLTITPEFEQALSHMEYLAEALEGSGVRVFPVDIQGAYDTAHIVLGDDIFYEMYDDPEFVHHLLSLSCDAIELAFSECLKRIPGSDQTVAHYNTLAMPRALGGIKLSEDTSTLLGKAQVDEFVAPYMRRILRASGGGYVHYCGRNPHLYRAVMDEPLAYGLNFGNPDMHDMDAVLSECAERRKIYYGVVPAMAGESEYDLFSRALTASLKDGRAHLLINYHCPAERAQAVSDAFDRAADRVLG